MDPGSVTIAALQRQVEMLTAELAKYKMGVNSAKHIVPSPIDLSSPPSPATAVSIEAAALTNQNDQEQIRKLEYETKCFEVMLKKSQNRL